MSISGIVFGVLIIFLFAFDLALEFPFGRASTTLDIGFIVAGVFMCLMGWSAMRSAR